MCREQQSGDGRESRSKRRYHQADSGDQDAGGGV